MITFFNNNLPKSFGKSLSLILMFFLGGTLNSLGQIYNAPKIEDHRNIQFDTLGVRIVKEIFFEGKLKTLKSKKVYDSDGFLIREMQYSTNTRWYKKLEGVYTFEYSEERSKCTEVWLKKDKSNVDTSFVKEENYDQNGMLLSKSERSIESDELKNFEYSYDSNGKCNSIRFSSNHGTGYIEHFTNYYDSVERVIKQEHTNKIGSKSVHLIEYKSNVKSYSSTSDNFLAETFKYNSNGQIEERSFVYDTTRINTKSFSSKMCVVGFESFEYNKEGRVITIKYNCDNYVNKESPVALIIEERFEYNSEGLLIIKKRFSDQIFTILDDKEVGIRFKYKLNNKYYGVN